MAQREAPAAATVIASVTITAESKQISAVMAKLLLVPSDYVVDFKTVIPILPCRVTDCTPGV